MSNGTGGARIRAPEEALAAVREQLQRIRFGSISLTIHDGEIVQLDVTETRRLRGIDRASVLLRAAPSGQGFPGRLATSERSTGPSGPLFTLLLAMHPGQALSRPHE